jgi:hypothetical protein
MAARTGATALAAVTALVALAGCEAAANARIDYSNTEKMALTAIRIQGGSGDVTVRGGGKAGEVRIDRVVRYRGDQPGKTYRTVGGELHLETECGRHCSVSYEVQAPTGVAVSGENGSGDLTFSDVAAVDVHLGSGNVKVTGSSGDVTVETGSGDVTVSRVAGGLDARAGSGSIEARGVQGCPAAVETGSGDVTLALGRPCDVRGHVASGNLTVTVPAGRYRVDTDTGSGTADIGVTNDPAAENVLDLESGSGDITVRPT